MSDPNDDTDDNGSATRRAFLGAAAAAAGLTAASGTSTATSTQADSNDRFVLGECDECGEEIASEPGEETLRAIIVEDDGDAVAHPSCVPELAN